MKKSFIILGIALTILGCGKEIEKNEKKGETIKREQNIPVAEKEIITRAQRIQYAIQYGLKNYYLEKYLGITKITIDKDISFLIKQIESLNSYTHINEDTFDIDFMQHKRLTDRVIFAFVKFINHILVTKIRRKCNLIE